MSAHPETERAQPAPEVKTAPEAAPPSKAKSPRVIKAAVAGLMVSTALLAALVYVAQPELDRPAVSTTDAGESTVNSADEGVAAAPIITWENGWRVSVRPRLQSLNDTSPVEIGSYTDPRAEFRWTDAVKEVVGVENPYLTTGTLRTGMFDFDPGVDHVFRISFIPAPDLTSQVCSLRFALDLNEVMKADGVKMEQGVATEVRLLSPKLNASEPVTSQLVLWSSCIRVTKDNAADSIEMDNMLGSRERLSGTASLDDPKEVLGAGLRIEVSRDGGDFTPVDGSEVRWSRNESEPAPVDGSPSFAVTDMAYGYDWTEVISEQGAVERVITSNRFPYAIGPDEAVAPVRLRTEINTDEAGPHLLAVALGRENQLPSVVSCHVAARIGDEELTKGVVHTGNNSHGVWLQQVDLEPGKHEFEMDFSCKPRGHRSLQLRSDGTSNTEGVELILMAKRPSETRLLPREDGFFALMEQTETKTEGEQP